MENYILGSSSRDGGAAGVTLAEAFLGAEGRTVLLVTGNTNVSLVAAKFLHAHGLGVSTAPDRATALAKFSAVDPDAVVIDAQDDIDGATELITALRGSSAKGASVPVVLGARPEAPGAFQAMVTRLDVKRVLADPFDDFENLLAVIAEVVEEHEAALRFAEREAAATMEMLDELLDGFVDDEEDLVTEDSARPSNPGQGLSVPVAAARPAVEVDVTPTVPKEVSGASSSPAPPRFDGEEGGLGAPVASVQRAAPAAASPGSGGDVAAPPPRREAGRSGGGEFELAPVPASGSLAEINVAELLARCHGTKVTGTVILRRGDDVRAICFDGGQPNSVESQTAGQTLADSLAAWGRLSTEQLREVLAEASSSGRSQHEILLAKGLISPHELFEALTQHVEERLIDLFAMTDGTFSIESPNFCGPDVVPLSLPFHKVFFAGLEKHFDRDRISRWLSLSDGSLIRVVASRAAELGRLEVPTTQARGLDLVRREVTVGRVLSTMGDEDRALTFLYGLYLLGFIRFSTTAPAAAPSSAATSPSPSVAEPSAASAKGSARDEELRRELEELRAADYFTLLGLERDATTEDVNKAFRARVKKLHPDKLASYDEEVRSLGAEVYRAIMDGYQILSDPGRRAEYAAELARADADAGAAGASASSPLGRFESTDPLLDAPSSGLERPMTSADLITQAQRAVTARKYDEAVEHIETAREQYGDNLRLMAWYAWVKYLQDNSHKKKSERLLKEALESNPNHHELNLLAARFYADLGDVDRAAVLYAQAEELAPSDPDVAREVRLFEKRSKKGGFKGSKGGDGGGLLDADVGTLFKRFFGKK